MVSPLIGSEVSDFTRIIFSPLAAAAYAVIGSYQSASFPFDNLGDTGTTVPGEYVSSEHAATNLDGKKISINILASSVAYKRCDQGNINPLRVTLSPTILSFPDQTNSPSPVGQVTTIMKTTVLIATQGLFGSGVVNSSTFSSTQPFRLVRSYYIVNFITDFEENR
jgi:hypothetical protein